MNQKTKNFLFWLPRILVIIFAVFISLFALDIFSEGYSFGQAIIGFFMHLIPTLLLLIILWIAWKWQSIGGLIFIALGLWYIISAGNQLFLTYLAISGPLFLIGLLFLINESLSIKK